MEDLAARRLRILKINDPLVSIHRISKYGAKGFDLAPSQALKVLAAWDAMSEEAKALLRQDYSRAETPAIDDDDPYAYGAWLGGERFVSWDSYDDDYYDDDGWWY